MNNLLLQVSKIVDTDKKLQEERRLRGEKFNIFSVLGLYQHEVKLHSKIISELLNAKGSHGLKDVFLQAFIEIVGLKDWGINTADSSSQIELSIGKINNTGDEGGRIDIVVTSSDKKAIIVENKIYANDQANQLLRYSNHANKKYSGFKLLYLNLDGSSPDPNSLGEKITNDNFKHITYQFHIKKWLERCVELSARQPRVRETIIQYLGIVNHITNQTMEKITQKEIINLISENFESAEQITNNFKEAKSCLQNDIKSKVCKKLNERLSDRFEVDNNGPNPQIWIRFRGENVPKHIFFGVESFVGGIPPLFVGVVDAQRKKTLIGTSAFPQEESYSPWWPSYIHVANFDGKPINMGEAFFLEKLYKNDKLKTDLIEHISESVIKYVENKATQLVDYNFDD